MKKKQDVIEIDLEEEELTPHSPNKNINMAIQTQQESQHHHSQLVGDQPALSPELFTHIPSINNNNDHRNEEESYVPPIGQYSQEVLQQLDEHAKEPKERQRLKRKKTTETINNTIIDEDKLLEKERRDRLERLATSARKRSRKIHYSLESSQSVNSVGEDEYFPTENIIDEDFINDEREEKPKRRKKVSDEEKELRKAKKKVFSFLKDAKTTESKSSLIEDDSMRDFIVDDEEEGNNSEEQQQTSGDESDSKENNQSDAPLWAQYVNQNRNMQIQEEEMNEEEDDDDFEQVDEENDTSSKFTSPSKAIAKHSQLFKVYIEFLARSVVDNSFYKTAVTDFKSREYYGAAFKAIEQPLSSKKDSVVASSVWSAEFKHILDSHSHFKSRDQSGLGDYCEACRRTKHPARFLIIISGKEYDSRSLLQLFSSTIKYTENGYQKFEFQVGSTCFKRVSLYHTCHHFKCNLIKRLKKKVEKLKMNDESLDAEELVEKILSNESWIQEKFKKWKLLSSQIDTFADSHLDQEDVQSYIYNDSDDSDLSGDERSVKSPHRKHTTPSKHTPSKSISTVDSKQKTTPKAARELFPEQSATTIQLDSEDEFVAPTEELLRQRNEEEEQQQQESVKRVSRSKAKKDGEKQSSSSNRVSVGGGSVSSYHKHASTTSTSPPPRKKQSKIKFNSSAHKVPLKSFTENRNVDEEILQEQLQMEQELSRLKEQYQEEAEELQEHLQFDSEEVPIHHHTTNDTTTTPVKSLLDQKKQRLMQSILEDNIHRKNPLEESPDAETTELINVLSQATAISNASTEKAKTVITIDEEEDELLNLNLYPKATNTETHTMDEV